MYTPNEYLAYRGMTSAVKYYRGDSEAMQLLNDLAFAIKEGARLILTLDRVSPATYLDAKSSRI